MKKTLALILAVLILMTELYGCGNDPSPSNPSNDNPVATPGEDENGNGNRSESGTSGNAVVTTSLPGTFEIAATEPHYFIAIPDWLAESYGLGFAQTEKGSTGYAIVVVACSYPVESDSLEVASSTLYTDGYNGILMQNYRAKYDAPPRPPKSLWRMVPPRCSLRISSTPMTPSAPRCRAMRMRW